jgi:GT2 family glycosyltransferase
VAVAGVTMAAGAPPHITVVLLHHDRVTMLPEALDSVRSQTCQPLDVVVVDNPSIASERAAEIVRARPGTRLMRLDANLGFAGGMNAGIAVADGKYTYLTEDDLILAPDCLEQLVHYMETHPGVGLVGGLMTDRDDGTVLYAGGDLALDRAFRLALPGRGDALGSLAAEPREVTYVPTGSALVRTALLKRLGGFRAEFFMYMEDVELCIRIAKAGYRLAVVPAARIRHIRPAPNALTESVQVHKWKNLVAVYLLHARLGSLLGFLSWHVLRQLMRGGTPGERRRILKALAWVARHSPGLLIDRWTSPIKAERV